MHRLKRQFLVVGALTVLAGCYHATIETGLDPSLRVIEDQWADGWVFGLVPPDPVQTAEKCTDGISKVETEHSFLNQLVGLLTIGIYTPMSIKVTCAAPGASEEGVEGADVRIDSNASLVEKQRLLTQAARLARATGSAVWVKFD